MREQEAERNRNKVSVAAAAAVKAKEAVEISVQMKHEAGAAADKAKHFKDPAFLQPADKILEADNEAAAAFDRFTKFTTTEMNAKLLHADSLVTDMNQADMNTVQGGAACTSAASVRGKRPELRRSGWLGAVPLRSHGCASDRAS